MNPNSFDQMVAQLCFSISHINSKTLISVNTGFYANVNRFYSYEHTTSRENDTYSDGMVVREINDGTGKELFQDQS